MPQFVVPPEGISFKDVITDFEKRLIESTLEAAGGVQKRAAELLHIKPTTLNEMIKRYDIRPRRKRRTATATSSSRPSSTAVTDRSVLRRVPRASTRRAPCSCAVGIRRLALSFSAKHAALYGLAFDLREHPLVLRAGSTSQR